MYIGLYMYRYKGNKVIKYRVMRDEQKIKDNK